MEFLSVYIPLYKKDNRGTAVDSSVAFAFVKKKVVMQGHSDHSMRIFSD